jgi:hypothetical protein
MDSWLIFVIVVAAIVPALVLWGLASRRKRPPESRRVAAGEHREKLARDAGVASFGLNLPWRRARR